jgi:pimeloyl-ACP methyl ester carboxylesterase
MPSFSSYDGTVLSYTLAGSGPLLICVPGGPARDSVYLGNLGGLDAHRTLVLLDNRGTGQSADAADPSDVDSYRADRLTGDVEALRIHLGLQTMDLLGHSAGAHVAVLYAAAHPDRISALALISGGHRAVGAAIEGAYVSALELRFDEPWYPDGREALDEWLAGSTDPEVKQRRNQFFYGRPFTEAARVHAEGDDAQRRNTVAAQMFPFQPDISAVRASLAQLGAPVLVYAGELDLSPRPAEAAAVAEAFPHAQLVVQPQAGHFPWVDDPAFFVDALVTHLPDHGEP